MSAMSMSMSISMRISRRTSWLSLFSLLALLWMVPAQAHKPSDSYLAMSVNGRQIALQWDIALRDLDMAIGLDENGDGALTWDEVQARHDAIAAYAMTRLRLSSGNLACPLALTGQLLDHHSDGAYAVLRMHARCATDIQTLEIGYRLLFDLDPQHKGLLRLNHGALTTTAIFTPERSVQTLTVAEQSAWRQFIDFAGHGVWHIWIGFDHILFLLSLLLPAVLVYCDGEWVPRSTFRATLTEVVKIVTAFTIAHSVTLTLATLGVIALPSRLVESFIAASVIVAALNNLWPLIPRRELMAGLFGLIHGFGFASVLVDLGLPQSALLLALVGFNAGVELGQLAIVAVFLPLAFAARRTMAYRRVVLAGGSLLIALVAAVWLCERLFDLQLIT